MSYRLTPSSSPQAGSMSRGTAMSISSSGRPSRAAITSSSSSRPTIGWGEEVEETTMSALHELLGELVEADDRCRRSAARG